MTGARIAMTGAPIAIAGAFIAMTGAPIAMTGAFAAMPAARIAMAGAPYTVNAGEQPTAPERNAVFLAFVLILSGWHELTSESVAEVGSNRSCFAVPGPKSHVGGWPTSLKEFIRETQE